jgi:Zn-finger nucleic acid-binding protein
MKCPVCSVDLMLADRQSIEIDYCPQCRGVWLDRGELDKILERSYQTPPERHRETDFPSKVPPRNDPGAYRESRAHSAPPVYHQENSRQHGHHRQKRKSFLEEIFDFD